MEKRLVFWYYFGNVNPKLLKPYNPKATEARVYELWEKSGYFDPDKLPARHKDPFSIVLPPPNVTGTLHMGHAAMLAIEDIVIRFERMRGKRALWLPGTDSAALATQAKVEDILYKKEKKTRHDIGREALLGRIEEFTKESEATIVNQVKRMGSSLDWGRYSYTMDETRNRAVNEAFKRMYEGGLIYRGARIVNWDPKLQTNVSDIEIEWKEETAPFYYLTYGPFTIGTARPETKFGDKYVVMHPDDERYKKYKHGDTLEVEWVNGPVTATIVKDKVVDMAFGTGVMTITPWHDQTDFDIAARHNLDKEQIIDQKGMLMPIAGEFAGVHWKKARPAIVEKLRAKGLVEKVDEKYAHRVATNSRGGGLLEPQVMLQWFVDVNKEFKLPHSELDGFEKGDTVTLKRLMQGVVESGQIEIIPDRFKKTYFHWIKDLRDWCISRQIWYGHQIPVWYRSTGAHDRLNGTPSDSRGVETHVGIERPEGEGWEQDPDTLDTWFSSGLWTFSTLGWPDKTKDLETFHPTDVLETGYDILFFWVARMVLMSTYLLGQIPFKKVYLHGLVRDGKGRKMSKSLGNIIDPLDMIEKYGADATRLSLIIGTAPGNDLKLSEDRVRGYKHFANKLWNVARFVLSNTEHGGFEKAKFAKEDAARMEEFEALKKEVTAHLDKYEFYLAGDNLYHYLWHTFADKVIEESKEALKGGNAAQKRSKQKLLHLLLEDQLKLLHPFIPFVTEELWSMLPHKKQSLLMIEPWPI
ncbi:MAG: valine--tRNA ligase [bacterium]|nr:valine--tRNA ligase [bacterium]